MPCGDGLQHEHIATAVFVKTSLTATQMWTERDSVTHSFWQNIYSGQEWYQTEEYLTTLRSKI